MEKKKTEKELLLALQKLDEDLLDPSLHEDAVDAELKAIGLDPATVAKRGAAFVFSLQEQKRLSWKEKAQQRRAQMEARAATASIPQDMDSDNDSRPTVGYDSEILNEFLKWLESSKEYLICRTTFGENRPIDESAQDLAIEFLKDQ